MKNLKKVCKNLKKENNKIKRGFFKLFKLLKLYKKKTTKNYDVIDYIIPFLDNIKYIGSFKDKKKHVHCLIFLKYILKKIKLDIIRPKLLDDYNPYIHQVIFSTYSKKKKILKVLKKGYVFCNKILRPALVCI
ncbi:nucleotide exchange factor GrpE [Candidatus Vidania fulgoroideorum]